MNPSPSLEEKRLIEREFVAKEAMHEKRRRFFQILFWLGVSTGSSMGFLRGFFEGRKWFSVLFALTYVVCSALYTEFIGQPRSFLQDADLRWQLNPWEEMLGRIKGEERFNRTLIILFAPLGSLIVGMVLRRLLD